MTREKRRKNNEKGKEKEKRKKVLQASLENEDKMNLKKFLEEFCFVANNEKEEIDEELQVHQCWQGQERSKDDYPSLVFIKKELKAKVIRLEQKNEDLASASTNSELALQLEKKDGKLHNDRLISKAFRYATCSK